jgi:hypothetical protein
MQDDELLIRSFDDGLLVFDLQSRLYYALTVEQSQLFEQSLNRRQFLTTTAGLVGVELSRTIAGSCSHPVPGRPPAVSPVDCPPGHLPGWPFPPPDLP